MKCMRDLKTAIMIILAVILLSMMMNRVGYHGLMDESHGGGYMGKKGYINGECTGCGC